MRTAARIWSLGLCAALSGCGSVYEPAGDLPDPPAIDSSARGFAARCAGCHGPAGEGTDLAPPIQSPHEGYAAWVVRRGRATAGSLDYPQDMPAFGETIDEAELDEIFTYLHERPLPEDGAGLYRRFCGNCHGERGSGGRVAESLLDEARDREDFIEEVREGNDLGAYGERYDFMPPRGRAELDDEQLERIRQYLVGD